MKTTIERADDILSDLDIIELTDRKRASLRSLIVEALRAEREESAKVCEGSIGTFTGYGPEADAMAADSLRHAAGLIRARH